MASVRYHALGAYAKSVYLVIFRLQTADHSSQVSTKPSDDGASNRQGNAMVEDRSGKSINFYLVSLPGVTKLYSDPHVQNEAKVHNVSGVPLKLTVQLFDSSLRKEVVMNRVQ